MCMLMLICNYSILHSARSGTPVLFCLKHAIIHTATHRHTPSGSDTSPRPQGSREIWIWFMCMVQTEQHHQPQRFSQHSCSRHFAVKHVYVRIRIPFDADSLSISGHLLWFIIVFKLQQQKVTWNSIFSELVDNFTSVKTQKTAVIWAFLYGSKYSLWPWGQIDLNVSE